MGIVGFSYAKLSGEKNKPVKGKISVNHNITVLDFEEQKLSIGSDKEKAFKVDFEFGVKYDPEVGNIVINAEVVAVGNKKQVDAALKKWKKDKKLEAELMAPLFEYALKKCRIKALFIAEEINLPAPFQLPNISVKTDKKK